MSWQFGTDNCDCGCDPCDSAPACGTLVFEMDYKPGWYPALAHVKARTYGPNSSLGYLSHATFYLGSYDLGIRLGINPLEGQPDFYAIVPATTLSVSCDGDGWKLTVEQYAEISDSFFASWTVVYALTVDPGSSLSFAIGSLISRSGTYHSGATTGTIDWDTQLFMQTDFSGTTHYEIMDDLPIPYAIENIRIHCDDIVDPNCTATFNLTVTGFQGEPLQCSPTPWLVWWYADDPDNVFITIGSCVGDLCVYQVDFATDDPDAFTADIRYYFYAKLSPWGFVDISGDTDSHYFEATVACGDVLSACYAGDEADGCIPLTASSGWGNRLSLNMPVPDDVHLDGKYGPITLSQPDYTLCDVYPDADARTCDGAGNLVANTTTTAVIYELINSSGHLALRKTAFAAYNCGTQLAYIADGSSCAGGFLFPPPETCGGGAAFLGQSSEVLLSGVGNNVSGSTECGPILASADQPATQTAAGCSPEIDITGWTESITVSGGL